MARGDFAKPLDKLRTNRRRGFFVLPDRRFDGGRTLCRTAPAMATAIKRFALHTDVSESLTQSLWGLAECRKQASKPLPKQQGYEFHMAKARQKGNETARPSNAFHRQQKGPNRCNLPCALLPP
jgi:hypothetical protein